MKTNKTKPKAKKLERLVRNYPSLGWVQVENCFVQKSHIISVEDDVPGEVTIRTAPLRWVLEGREADRVLKALGFNGKV